MAEATTHPDPDPGSDADGPEGPLGTTLRVGTVVACRANPKARRPPSSSRSIWGRSASGPRTPSSPGTNDESSLVGRQVVVATRWEADRSRGSKRGARAGAPGRPGRDEASRAGRPGPERRRGPLKSGDGPGRRPRGTPETTRRGRCRPRRMPVPWSIPVRTTIRVSPSEGVPPERTRPDSAGPGGPVRSSCWKSPGMNFHAGAPEPPEPPGDRRTIARFTRRRHGAFSPDCGGPPSWRCSG